MSRNTILTKGKIGSNRRIWRKPVIQFCLILSLVVLFLVVPSAASPAFAQEGVVHVVQPGESLSSIASRYGVNMYALARYNGIGNINLLRVGQVLRIPETTVAQPVVQPAYPTPTRVRISNPSDSYEAPEATPTPYIVNYPTPTPTILVPTPTPAASTTRVHVVAAFDTLTSIANLYGTSVWAIKSRNGLISDKVYRGQRLIIP